MKNPQVIEKTLQNLNLERSKQNFEVALTELRKIPNPRLKNTNSNVIIYEFFDFETAKNLYFSTKSQIM